MRGFEKAWQAHIESTSTGRRMRTPDGYPPCPPCDYPAAANYARLGGQFVPNSLTGPEIVPTTEYKLPLNY
ncbi:hypothetical protein SAMN05421863_10497 [Nitrosomonas communis]|uniref:Uncharacterized protein n=1 Tax=Nitrosomonas communis TaxID=44574 RepID=A0A1I4TC16_9PROT|nr:hypothetical protein SAMN05421863_10497 [Nitrosomonas communis]